MVLTLLPRLAMAVLAILTFIAPATAQNYDGQGLVKFGIFDGGTWMDVRSKNPSRRDANMDGATFGMSAGYDYVFNRRLLLGVEADVSVGDIHGDLNGMYPMHLQWMSTLRGRLGLFLTPQFLIYGTAGAAWAGLDIKHIVPVTSTTGAALLNASDAVAGYAVGGGLEYDLGTRWGIIAFAEYLHTGFSAWNRVPGLGFDLDSEADVVRVGFKFKVGHDHRWGEFYDYGREPLK
jgi:opacity protein-like surface antigen